MTGSNVSLWATVVCMWHGLKSLPAIEYRVTIWIPKLSTAPTVPATASTQRFDLTRMAAANSAMAITLSLLLGSRAKSSRKHRCRKETIAERTESSLFRMLMDSTVSEGLRRSSDPTASILTAICRTRFRLDPLESGT